MFKIKKMGLKNNVLKINETNEILKPLKTNADLQIGGLYWCHISDLSVLNKEAIDELDKASVIDLLDIYFYGHNNFKTILKYLGSGLFCEYYTQNLVLGIRDTADIQLSFNNNLIMVDINDISFIEEFDNTIINEVFAQEEKEREIVSLLNSIYDVQQTRIKKHVEKDWEGAIAENNARIRLCNAQTRLRQLKEMPVIEK